MQWKYYHAILYTSYNHPSPFLLAYLGCFVWFYAFE